MQAIVDSYQDDRNLPRRVDQLRLACILDELSEKFFPFECKCVNLNATMWESQIERFNPHLLFVESVWNGYQKTWYGKVASRVSNELVQVVNWCKARKIPTVFWNKEDPIHTFTFLGAAFLFDFIFTTDMDCIPLYKRLLGHNRVGVLPFATSIQLFTPIDTYDRKDAACFAGSYYGKFKDRSSDLDAMFETLIGNYSLDIYDRNPYPNDPARNFPERFRSHIIGTLSPDEIEIAYKSYKLGITLNIVKNSSTMEARRIFELLSSNTFTASNSCRGIKNLFGDLVLYYENPDQFVEKIKTILSDRDTYERLRLLGLRKVIQQHTYKERLEYLFTRVFNANPDVTSPKIAVFSIVKTKQDLTWVKAAYLRQNHTHKQLLLFSDSTEISSLNGETEIHSTNLIHQVLAGDFDYYAYFSPRNYYGKNYLLDLALSTRYATVSAIGKSAFFANKDEKLQYQEGLGSYRLIDRLQIDRAMFAAHLLKSITPLSITSDSWLENLPCLSIDAYNFCENYTKKKCPAVDDLKINEGISMRELHRISESLPQSLMNYTLGTVLSGSDLQIEAKNNNFKVEELPLRKWGFFSLGNRTIKVSLGNKISLEKLKFIEEPNDKKYLHIVINGHTMGRVVFHINYYTEKDEYLGGYLVLNKAGMTIPVPPQAAYCKLSITTEGESFGFLKEIFFAPHISEFIDLHPAGVS